MAHSLEVGLGTVSGVERRARAAGLDWAQVEALSEDGRFSAGSGVAPGRGSPTDLRVVSQDAAHAGSIAS